MRDGYLLCVALLFGDGLVFWLCKQFGAFQAGHIPPNWVKVVFTLPVFAASVIAVSLLICGAKAGIVYDFNGGRKLKFSENPFYSSIVFAISLFGCTLMLFASAFFMFSNNG
jgi:hypothetical protein